MKKRFKQIAAVFGVTWSVYGLFASTELVNYICWLLIFIVVLCDRE